LGISYPRCLVVLSVLLDDLALGAEARVHTFEVVPRAVEWERNPARAADTFRVELAWQDLPLDPRAVRSVLVAVYCADLGQQDATLTIARRDALVFLGYVDEPEATFDEHGEGLRLEGRDYTALLLDHRWTGGSLDLRRPLGALVAQVIAAVPGAEGLRVEIEPAAAGTTLEALVGRRYLPPGQGDDAWTLLTELVGRAGLLITVELDAVVVRPAGVRTRPAARFRWGEQLLSLRLRRRASEVRSAQIELRCWDEAAGEGRSARYPDQPIVLRKKVGANGRVTSETAPLRAYSVSGRWTVAQLRERARVIYEEEAREQLEGTLETAELVDGTTLLDLPQLANGDRVVVEWGQELAGVQGMSDAEATAYLSAPPRSLNPVVAAALVQAGALADRLATTFYVHRARHRWSGAEGYRLSVDFINLVGAGGRT